MKKFYLFILAAIATTASWADSRSAQQMLRIAQQKLGTNVTEAQTSVNGAKGTTVDNQAYTTFNAQNGKGYVIVGADDRLPEVIGYCTSGSFDMNSMAPDLQDALDKLNKRLPYMKNTYKATDTKYTPVDALIATLWNQDAPYHNNCPTYINLTAKQDTCPTGCVATALAQVINYWGQQEKFPVKGDGIYKWTSKNVYSSRSTTYDLFYDCSYDFSTPLDFGKMQNYYGTTYFDDTTPTYISYDDAHAAAVANLMQACGALANMGYGTSMSGSQVTYLDAVEKYYGFAPGSQLLHHTFYTESEWMAVINDQMTKHYPIPFCAFTLDNASGHAFVLDGIDADGNVHINWGWGGKSNGYFNIEYLFPDQQGTGGSDSPEAYCYNQQMAINFAPQETTPVSNYRCRSLDFTFADQSLIIDGFATISHARKSTIGISVTSVSTKESGVVIISPEETATLLPDTIQEEGGIIPSNPVPVKMDFTNVADGWYMLEVVTKDPGQTTWSLVRTPLNYHSYLYVKVENGRVVAGSYDDTENLNILGEIKLDNTNLKVGSAVPVDVMVANTGNMQLTDCVTYLFIANADTTLAETDHYFNSATRAITLQPKESAQYQIAFVPEEAGEYVIRLAVQLPQQKALQMVSFITDTIHISVEKAVYDSLSVDYPCDIYDGETFTLDKDYDFSVYAKPRITLPGVTKVKFSVVRINDAKTQLVRVFSDTLLVNDVQGGDPIKHTFTVPKDRFKEDVYFFLVNLSNEALQQSNDLGYSLGDLRVGLSGFAVRMVMPTAIREIESTPSNASSAAAYDLFGRRVNANTYRGIMIQNGKKRIVK